MLYDLRNQELKTVYAELIAGDFLVQQTIHNKGNNYTVTALCIGP